jgi:hypothetical protein
LLASHAIPQTLLGVRHSTTQPAGIRLEVAGIRAHDKSKSPLPPFCKGGIASFEGEETLGDRPLLRPAAPCTGSNADAAAARARVRAPLFPPLKKGGRGDLLLLSSKTLP